MIDRKKTTQDILQGEMHRERALVLARAGEKVTAALERLAGIDAEIALAMAAWGGQSSGSVSGRPGGDEAKEVARGEINQRIHAYNRQRERLRRCCYELIVTREALGLIHHEWLEEFYRVPPRKKPLPEP